MRLILLSKIPKKVERPPMKKTSKLLPAICIISIFLLLTSCSQNAAEARPSAGLDEPAEGVSQALTPYLVTSRYGINNSYYAVSEEGAYFLVDNSDRSANIAYIDFSTRQQIFLSSQPDSLHNDETDTSWVEDVPGSSTLFVAGDSLYLLASGLPSQPPNEGDFGYILQMDMNGGNRQKIFEISGDMWISSSIAFDGVSLYFLATVYSESGSEIQLIALDTQSKRSSVMASFAPDAQYFLVGTYHDGLILKTISLTRADAELSPNEWYSHQIHTLYSYSFSSRELKEEMSWAQDERSEIIYENKIYYVDSHSGQLFCQEIGQTTPSDVLVTLPSHDDTVMFKIISEVYDNHIFVQASASNGIYQTYHINLDTYHYSPVGLHAEDRTVGVVAETDGLFLVTLNMQTVMRDGTDPDGRPMQQPYTTLAVCLMPKEAYWNSRPEYIEIEDHVFRSLR